MRDSVSGGGALRGSVGSRDESSRGSESRGGGGSSARRVVGWREWVALPALGVDAVKVKVDTGARSSALHAGDIVTFERGGVEWVRFVVFPRQRSRAVRVVAEAPLLESRRVRDSGGRVTVRPVVVTPVSLFGESWDVEVTLVDRDAMGFRMLLGREALKRRFVVDPARSFVAGRGPGGGAAAADAGEGDDDVAEESS